MADYFSPTVIQPTIPAADITPLERLLLSHIFNAEGEGEELYFYADEGPADMVWLDRHLIEAALAQSPAGADSAAASFVNEQLARVPKDNVEIELDVSDAYWQFIFQDIVRRSPSLHYVTAVTAFTCSKMRPDGFGGMAILITGNTVTGKSTNDIIEDFLAEAGLDTDAQVADLSAAPRGSYEPHSTHRNRQGHRLRSGRAAARLPVSGSRLSPAG